MRPRVVVNVSKKRVKTGEILKEMLAMLKTSSATTFKWSDYSLKIHSIFS